MESAEPQANQPETSGDATRANGGGTTLVAPAVPTWMFAPLAVSVGLGLVIAHWAINNAVAQPTVYSGKAEVSRADRIAAALPQRGDRKVARESAVLGPIANERNPDYALALKWPVPTIDTIPLDEKFPTLRDWIHPVTGSTELVPTSPGRWFGAERAGVFRWECGAGHCGVDLDGPRGRALVAVAGGKVIRVERSELGRDGRSGRYVRIEHEDGTLTAYMHMDDIAPGIDVGVVVEAGQFIGTLGATAVYQSAPHCHFTLELPNSMQAGGRDTTDTTYIDPAPFLARSRVIALQ